MSAGRGQDLVGADQEPFARPGHGRTGNQGDKAVKGCVNLSARLATWLRCSRGWDSGGLSAPSRGLRFFEEFGMEVLSC